MKKQTKKSSKQKDPKAKKGSDKLRILAAGDFHGNPRIAKQLAERAEREKVDLVILTGDLVGLVPTKEIIKPFKDKKQRIVFVPGNWETEEDAQRLEAQYKIKNLENHYLKYKNTGLIGIGSADWALYPDEEQTFEHLKKEHSKIKDLEKKILVSHIHAAGTKSELSGFEGNMGLRKAIEKFQPDIFISGHIHELEGVEEKIGKTRVINVGKKGKILEI
jgi:uncharacterized protein